jgi:hypothetical protein
VCQFERCLLAGTLEQDRVVAGITKEQPRGQPFLDVAVETAEHDERALGLRWHEAIGGQPARLIGNATVRRGRDLEITEN